MYDKVSSGLGILTLLLVALVASPDVLSQIPSIRDKQQTGKPFLPRHRREFRSQPPFPVTMPPGPVHSCAEWEESEGVMTLWWNHDLIDRLQENTTVYIPVDDVAEQDSWISHLDSHGIPLTNIEFLFITTNTIYTRDYGPWFIRDANGDLGIVNYTCDYGYWDDLFPENFASLFGIDFYESGLRHVGGNWYPNAYGTAFSTTMVYWSNWELTPGEVDDVMYDYYGIEQYNTAAVAPWTIEHHDCWGKPSNPETMLIARFPEDSEYFPYAEAMNDHYETLESPWGRPYRIIRMPMFRMGSGWYEFRPYLNALVSNEHVYVPVTDHPDDQAALSVFQQAFPGYTIVGVDHMGTGFNDALHCRTRNFVKRDAIRIYPFPPGDTEETQSDYTVLAEIIPPKGSSLLDGYPVVHWSDTGIPPFSEVVMTSTGQPDEYTADIPAQPLDTEISFYIEARDDSGHSAVHPPVAPEGLLHFRVMPDTTPPVLSRFTATRSVCSSAWPPTVRTLCKDNMTVPAVRVEWSINGEPQPDVDLVREHRRWWYSGTFAGSAVPGDVVTYRVVSTDNAEAQNTAILPRVGEVHCPVTGPGDVAVVELSTRPRTGPFLADALGRLGIPYTYYTTWPTGWERHPVWFISLGITPDNYVLSSDEALEITAALDAGSYIYLESSDTWCWDSAKDILNPWFRVQEVDDGGNLYGDVAGQPGTLMEGLILDYAWESAYMDEIGAQAGAEVLFRSVLDDEGRSVLYSEAGGYRTIASSFALGGLLDGEWPQSRKQVLLKILDFFETGDISLRATESARPGSTVTLELEGLPGNEYVVAASLRENYRPCPYGVLRIDLKHMQVVGQGEIPPGGAVNIDLAIPDNADLPGLDVHLQAMTGEGVAPPVDAELTNREVLTIIP